MNIGCPFAPSLPPHFTAWPGCCPDTGHVPSPGVEQQSDLSAWLTNTSTHDHFYKSCKRSIGCSSNFCLLRDGITIGSTFSPVEQQLLAGARCRVGVHNSSVRRYPAPASQPFLSIINNNKPVFSFTFGYLNCKYKNKHSTLRCTVAIYCGSLDIFLVFFQLMILDSLRWSVAIWRQRYTSDRS